MEGPTAGGFCRRSDIRQPSSYEQIGTRVCRNSGFHSPTLVFLRTLCTHPESSQHPYADDNNEMARMDSNSSPRAWGEELHQDDHLRQIQAPCRVPLLQAAT